MADKPKKTALILGASGRLGTLLRGAWAQQPPEAIDLFFQSRGPLNAANTICWSPDDGTDALPACDTVIALWGQTSGDFAGEDMNVTLAHESRAVARACKARRLIHLSSAAVYGPARGAAENTPPDPVNPYGRSKLMMEECVSQFDDPGLAHICLRLANVVGADSLAPALAGSGGVTLDRFDDGAGPLRSYIGAGDLAQVLTALCQLPPQSGPDILNVAAHQPIAMEDLARAAGKKIRWRDAPSSAVQIVTMQTSRMASLLPEVTPETDPSRLIAQWWAQGSFTKL